MATLSQATSSVADENIYLYASPRQDNFMGTIIYPSPSDPQVRLTSAEILSLYSKDSHIPVSILQLHVARLLNDYPALQEKRIVLCRPPNKEILRGHRKVESASEIIRPVLRQAFKIGADTSKERRSSSAMVQIKLSSELLTAWELIIIPLHNDLRWSLLVLNRCARTARCFDTSWSFEDPREKKEVYGGYNSRLAMIWASEVTDFLHEETSKLANNDTFGVEAFLTKEEKAKWNNEVVGNKRYSVFILRKMNTVPQGPPYASGAVTYALVDLVVEKMLSIGVEEMKESTEPSLAFQKEEIRERSANAKEMMQKDIEKAREVMKKEIEKTQKAREDGADTLAPDVGSRDSTLIACMLFGFATVVCRAAWLSLGDS